jgi:hypothetical protein
LSFEVIIDKEGRSIRPRKGLLFYTRRANFSGKTESGIFVDGPDHLPTVYGIIVAIRHDNPWCVLNLPRDEGGLMPEDLIHFQRYTGDDVTGVRQTILADRYNEETRAWEQVEVETIEPLYAMAEEAVLVRVDGVLPDPWAKALAELAAPVVEWTR